MNNPASTQQDRLHALDALRAFALLLGVAYHAAISFLGSSEWAIADSSTSVVAGIFFFLSHMFRMSLFFLIAGFFAHLLYHRKGALGFWRDRAKRILVPLVLGLIVMIPLLGMLWRWGANVDGREMLDPAGATLRLTHLWFLYYLLLIYGIALTARGIFVQSADRYGVVRGWIDQRLVEILKARWTPLLLALPLGVCFASMTGWFSFEGIPTPDRSLVPQWPALIGYGTAFSFGWLLHRQPNAMQPLVDRYVFYFSCAVVLSLVTFIAPGIASGRFGELVSALSYSMASWCWNFAWIGLALKHFSGVNPRMRYVADASYWIYLAHLPLVVALQIVVARWNWHWSFKFLLILAIAYPALLLTYHYLVRFTVVGAVLNGRMYQRSVATVTTTDESNSAIAK